MANVFSDKNKTLIEQNFTASYK